MKTSHGVIQGYDGVATVDSKRQVVVHAEVFGEAPEHDLQPALGNGGAGVRAPGRHGAQALLPARHNQGELPMAALLLLHNIKKIHRFGPGYT